jgi:hypothetical protein
MKPQFLLEAGHEGETMKKVRSYRRHYEGKPCKNGTIWPFLRQVYQTERVSVNILHRAWAGRQECVSKCGGVKEWAALVIDGEEIVPAGRPNWLRFAWLSEE